MGIVWLGASTTYQSWTTGKVADELEHQRERGDKASADRDALQRSFDQQNQDLLCFADSVNRWELGVSDLLLAEVRDNPNNPERAAALDQLRQARLDIANVKALCFRNQGPPLPEGTTQTGTTTTTSTTAPG